MDIKSKIILISGPTASGKSYFAIKLAKKINGEIINADSMQVYKEIKILTARPKKKEYQEIKHHLYGTHSVKKKFSTGNWLTLVLKIIKEIKKKNKTPIIVGGTGLYFKVLTEGLVKIPHISIKKRNEIKTLQENIGQKNFYNKLIKLDPLINKFVDAGDVQRSIRAYEVKKFTKKSIREWYKYTNTKFNKDDFYKLYIDFPRSELIEKIFQRTGKMIQDGAISEVSKFLKLNIGSDNSANKIIGISEIKEFLDKKIDLVDVRDKISIKTRQYAKRQSTWARGQMIDWVKINRSDQNKFIKKIK